MRISRPQKVPLRFRTFWAVAWQRGDHILRFELLQFLRHGRAQILEDYLHLRACLVHVPGRVDNGLRVEVPQLLGRCSAESLEDIRSLRACLGHGPEYFD